MVSLQMFENYNEKLDALFPPDKKYTFLVGAGISIDYPTNMPSAKEIVKTLLEFCAPPEEIEHLLNLKMLRYELVVEKIQNLFDNDLKFMDYIEKVISPNLIHIFLANLIIRGHYVITTNFDYLIEQALIKILPEDHRFNIYPIITKEDFLSFQDPIRLVNTGKYPVYKIHGSKRNIITGQLVQESLITTISALGREREEGVTFAIEPYKKPAIYNLMKDRTLVIMGYSGSDDFDIGPMLRELPFLSRLIWIEHSFDNDIKIIKVNKTEFINDKENLNRTERLLAEISIRGDFEIFLIKTHTRNFIKNNFWELLLPHVSSDVIELVKINEDLPVFDDWIKSLYMNIPLVDKYRLACQLFYFLKEINATIRCAEKGNNLAEKLNLPLNKTHFLDFLGMINLIQGKYEDALKLYQESLLIDEKFENLNGKTGDLSNIGSVFLSLGKYDEAFKKFEEALLICEKTGDLESKITNLNNIGRIYEIRGEYDLALKKYIDGFHITEKLGDLGRKSTILNNIGMIYGVKGEFDLALKNYEDALHIADQLGDLYGKIILLNNIGRVYAEQKDYDAAMEKYEETLKIAEQLGDLSKKAGCLNNIGSNYLARGNLGLALEKYKEALNIEEKLGDPLMKAIYLNNIGMIYTSQNEYTFALNSYQTALNITKEIGDNSKVALFLTKIGGLYIKLDDLKTALEKYLEAEKIYGQLGDLTNRAACLSNIGKIYEKQGQYETALSIYKKTLEIDEQLNDLMGMASDLNNIGKIYEIINSFNEALKYYKKALEIFKQLDQKQYVEFIQNIINKLLEKSPV
jgi:tetratricopeptide (TPR) repeat protein